MDDSSIRKLFDEMKQHVTQRTDGTRLRQLTTMVLNDTGVHRRLENIEASLAECNTLLTAKATRIFGSLKYEQVTTDALAAYEKSLNTTRAKIEADLQATNLRFTSMAQQLQQRLDVLSNTIKDYHTTANILLEKSSSQTHSISATLTETTSEVTSQLQKTKSTLDSMYSLPEKITALISDLLVTLSGLQNAVTQGGSVIAAATNLSGRIAEATSVTKQLSSVANPLVVALDKAAYEAETLNTNLGNWQASLLQNLPSNPGLAEALITLGNQLISVLHSGNNIAKLKAVADTAKSVTDAAVNVKELTSKEETYASL